MLLSTANAAADAISRPNGFTAEHIPALYVQNCAKPPDNENLVEAMLTMDLVKPGKEKAQAVKTVAENVKHCINTVQQNMLALSWMTADEKKTARDVAASHLGQADEFARSSIDRSVSAVMANPTRFILPVLDASSGPRVKQALAMHVGPLFARCGKRPEVPHLVGTEEEAIRLAKKPDAWRRCFNEASKESKQYEYGIADLEARLPFAEKASRFRCKKPESPNCISDKDWMRGGAPMIEAHIETLKTRQAEFAALERLNRDWMQAYDEWEDKMEEKFDTFYARNWEPIF